MNLKYEIKSRISAVRQTPNIHLVTMPKTGTQTIRNILMDCLQVPRRHIHNGQFPHEQLGNETKTNRANQRYLSSSHWAPNRHNCVVARNSGQNKIIVNIRDPRQATLSWVHHVAKLRKNQHPDFDEIDLCPDYYHEGNKDINALLDMDFFIEKYFTELITWLKAWENAEQANNGLDIKIVTFETFKNDPHQYFQQLLLFLDCDPALSKKCANHSLINGKYGKSHFRKGLIDEWKTVFSPEQIKFCNEHMSKLNLQNYNYEI